MTETEMRMGGAEPRAGTTMTPDDVVGTHKEFNRALTTRDFDALSRLYADDYMLVRPDGSVLSKKEVLQDLQTGGLTFKSIEIANITVRVYGDTALLTCDSRT
jgi:ketosteroid isomerase-like protein